VSEEERQSFVEFVAFVLRFISRHGTPAEQAAALEHWQAVNEAFRD
jgi:hypothetical protein